MKPGQISNLILVLVLIKCSLSNPEDLRTKHVPKVRNNYHSYIYIRRINTKKLLCSGALIKLTVAITAAKCVKKWEMSISTYSGRQRGYEVVAGLRAKYEGVPEWDDNKYVKRSFFDVERIPLIEDQSLYIGPEETVGTQARTITLITISNNYREDSPFIDDLALLEVRESFFESEYVTTVITNSLRGSSAKIEYGSILTTFGVGKYPNGTPAVELTYQEIIIVNPSYCGYGRNFTKWLCFQEKLPLPINTHCDPGDPIFFRDILIGITSWISLVNRPGYYIGQNISTHEQFIETKVQARSLKKMRSSNIANNHFDGNLSVIVFLVVIRYLS